MKNDAMGLKARTSKWRKLLKILFLLNAIGLAILNVNSYSLVSERSELAKAESLKLADAKRRVEEFEAKEKKLRELVSSHRKILSRFGELNRVAPGIQHFVVPDPDQVIAVFDEPMDLSEINFGYRGYVPKGEHCFKLVLWDAEAEPWATEYLKPVEFDLVGPTKFEVIGTVEGEAPHRVVKIKLALPGGGEQIDDAEFSQPVVSVGGFSQTNYSDQCNLFYPSQIQFGFERKKEKLALGIEVGPVFGSFQVKRRDGSVRPFRFAAFIDSKARYCASVSDVIRRPFEVQQTLRLASREPEQFSELFEFNPEVPGQFLLRQELSDGLRQTDDSPKPWYFDQSDER